MAISFSKKSIGKEPQGLSNKERERITKTSVGEYEDRASNGFVRYKIHCLSVFSMVRTIYTSKLYKIFQS